MMEKNGMLTLTDDDMKMYKEGKVSDRLKKEWEMDYSSLDGMVKEGSFRMIDVNTENKSGDK